MSRTHRLIPCLAASALLLAGCGTARSLPSTQTDEVGSTTKAYSRYVALGDSFQAGPGIPTGSGNGCARSTHNYASDVNRSLDPGTFVDVTCSGATTSSLINGQTLRSGQRVRSQLSAVTAGTDLVTVGIGGNDFSLYHTVVATCTGLRHLNPTGSPCSASLARKRPTLSQKMTTLTSRVTTVLRKITSRAPHARVVFVGYPRFVPTNTTCRGMSLATGDYALGRRIMVSVNAAQRRAARATGATFVDMYAASSGHAICRPAAWVNDKTPDPGRAAAYHPFSSGMAADAKHVLAALGS